MAVAKLPLLGGVALTAAAIPTGLYIGSVVSKPEETPAPTAPELVSLKKAGEFQSASNPSKFGERFSYFFLSNTKTENDSEWSKRAEALKNSQTTPETSGFFTSIKANATGTSFKGKCKEAYDQTDFSNENKWKEVWTHCSLLGEKPTTLEESKTSLNGNSEANEEVTLATATNTASKWGEHLKTTVISTYDPKNEKFWELRNQEFKAAVADQTNGENNYFRKSQNKDAKTLCRDIYKQQKSDSASATNPSEADLKKWCSIDKTTS